MFGLYSSSSEAAKIVCSGMLVAGWAAGCN